MDLFVQVDEYLGDALLEPDAALEGALERSAAAGLPPIAVSALQGKLLHLLVRISGAHHVLEVGTLGGYSTIWLARAASTVTTLELDPHHADVARENLAAAGLSNVTVVEGPALETLATLTETVDFAFIDADKANNPRYVEQVLRLSRPGTVIVVDNTVRQGRVADATLTDADVVGTRELFELLRSDPRVDATTIQTVGLKGHDGFTLCRVS
ncbi:MAG: methyltransferase [Frankiales bacterium]|nr:methyltransferase [Frankiales bacterium]